MELLVRRVVAPRGACWALVVTPQCAQTFCLFDWWTGSAAVAALMAYSISEVITWIRGYFGKVRARGCVLLRMLLVLTGGGEAGEPCQQVARRLAILPMRRCLGVRCTHVSMYFSLLAAPAPPARPPVGCVSTAGSAAQCGTARVRTCCAAATAVTMPSSCSRVISHTVVCSAPSGSRRRRETTSTGSRMLASVSLPIVSCASTERGERSAQRVWDEGESSTLTRADQSKSTSSTDPSASARSTAALRRSGSLTSNADAASSAAALSTPASVSAARTCGGHRRGCRAPTRHQRARTLVAGAPHATAPCTNSRTAWNAAPARFCATLTPLALPFREWTPVMSSATQCTS